MLKSIQNIELFRYLIVGSFAFLCDISILFICTELFGLHYLVSALFGYCAGLIISYLLNIKWVFNYRKYRQKMIEFSIFNLIVVTGLLLNEAIIYVAVNSFQVSYIHGKFASGLIVFMFNYSAKKFLLFRESKPSPYISRD